MRNRNLSGTCTDSNDHRTASCVLCVEPDEGEAAAISSALEERTEVDSVLTVKRASDALSALSEHPVECVVSEYTLPDGNGLDLFETIREQYGSIPFLLYTAAGSEAVASDALSAGVTEYISKQRDEEGERLADAVETVLEDRHTIRERPDATLDEFRTLVDDIEDHAIFLLDSRGHVTSWNRGAEYLKGYRREEILGECFSTFYPAEAVDDGKPSRMLAEARARGRATDEGWRVRKDGTRFWASVVITTLRDDDGAVRGFAKFTRDLTEQHERERRIREQHELTERILDTVPVGVAIYSVDGELVRTNSRARELLWNLGVEATEGGPISEVDAVYDVDGEPVDEQELPSKRVVETGESITDREFRIDGTNGETRWVSVNVVPMYDQTGDRIERVISTGRDITALKEREAELEAIHGELQATVEELRETNRQLEVKENRFEALTENSSVAVLTIDGSSTVQFANSTVAEILGYDPGELIGESLTKIMPERLVDDHLRAVNRYVEGGDRQLDWEWIELPAEHKDGHEVELGLSFGETMVDGDYLFTAVVRDITERKQRQRELERRREELNELVEELERSNDELEQFAYVVSHDLKEPLRMVRSYLELLERRYGAELDGAAEEFIDLAVDGATRMQRMIDDILKFSKVGRDTSEFQPVACTAVLEEVREMLPIDGTPHELTVGTLPTVWGNRTQLTTLFQNLLSNAFTHSERPVTACVSAELVGDEWRITVTDDGKGIPMEDQEHVFELFNAVGPTGGTGVGLAICRKIVTQHGGTITVDSTPGEGTTFSFTLPDARVQDARNW